MLTWNRGTFLVAMHLIAIVHFGYGLYWEFSFAYPPVGHPGYARFHGFGGKFRFTSILCVICQTFYFALCLLNDFIGTNENYPKRPSFIRKLKDFVFSAFACPLAMSGVTFFWAMFLFDRELVQPKSFEPFLPRWLNHVMHSNMGFFIALEMLLSYHKYPSRKSGSSALLAYHLSYLVWLHIIKYKADVWVYPILDVLTLPQRLGFFLALGIFCVSFYFVGEYLNNKIWGKELSAIKTSGNKQS